MKYFIIQLSKRKYVIGELEGLGRANLNVFSFGRLGETNEMVNVNKIKIITKPLDYPLAMLLYCYLVTGNPISEEHEELFV